MFASNSSIYTLNFKLDRTLEYVDYLLCKYAEEESPNPAYDKLLEEMLVQRYQAYRSNPGSAISSDEFSQRIHEKYGWNK